MKRRRLFRVPTACLIFLLGIALIGNSYDTRLYAVTQAASQNVGGLTIMVIEGEASVNIIKKKTAVKPVVEVRDRNNLPVAGAIVVFLTPGSGASATFAGGAHTSTVITNSVGRAAVSKIQPVEPEGAFKIGVTASFNGQTAATVIAQKNFLTKSSAIAAGEIVPTTFALSTGAIVGILAAGAGIAAAGVVLKKSGGSEKTTATIGIGGTPGLSNPFNGSR